MSALENLAPDRREVVRREVRTLLEKSDSFRLLEPKERSRVAQALVDVVAFLADPAAGQRGLPTELPASDERSAQLGLAETLAKSGADKVQDRLAKKQDLVGKDFVAGAAQAGTRAFRELVDAVDFPKFVSGLVEGVFTSIVDSSIRQMEAYGKLLEAVVKSVDEFASENFTLNQGRDFLVERFPDKLTVRVEGDTPRLAMLDDAADGALADIGRNLGMNAAPDLDDEASEAELARRAQLEMARLRQKQLATMVLLGINRIVVTDGLINAKVMFDVKASDTASRQNTASMHDKRDIRRQHGTHGGWSSSFDHTNDHHTTVVQSSSSDQSESKLNVKAQLSGEVRVNFKSETFNLNQMASTVQIDTVNERAKPA